MISSVPFRSILVFCKWQSICVRICLYSVSVWAKSFFNVAFNTCSWNVIEWRCWWNGNSNGQHNRFRYATLRYICRCNSIDRVCSVVYTFVQLLYNNMPICENTLKRCLPSSKNFFEMGSLKAIADNQHVKYAIFAKYTKCVCMWGETTKTTSALSPALSQSHAHSHIHIIFSTFFLLLFTIWEVDLFYTAYLICAWKWK